jgi:pyruvate dehydrogenase E2 component (dihydrolipoamide acetyltransferase)
MATIVFLPKIGKFQKEGSVDRWRKSEGDPVKVGDLLFDCHDDKSEMTVGARANGILLKILLDPMVTAPVLSPVAVIGEPGEDPDAALEEWKKSR